MIEALAWVVTMLMVLSIVPALVVTALVALVVCILVLVPWSNQ